jgi:hypothetical protein
MRGGESLLVHWRFICECGTSVSADSDDDLVMAAYDNLAAEHPSVSVPPSRADVLAMAECCDERGTLETLG